MWIDDRGELRVGVRILAERRNGKPFEERQKERGSDKEEELVGGKWSRKEQWKRETGREHGRSSYQHTLDTFINARRARRGFAGAASRISCVRQAAKQRVKCSSFSDLPSFCLALLCPLRALPSPPLVSRLSNLLRVATAKVKKVPSRNARACKTASRRSAESTKLLPNRRKFCTFNDTWIWYTDYVTHVKTLLSIYVRFNIEI